MTTENDMGAPRATPSELLDLLGMHYATHLAQRGLLPPPPADASPGMVAAWQALERARNIEGAALAPDTASREVDILLSTTDELLVDAELPDATRAAIAEVDALLRPFVPTSDDDFVVTWEDLFDVDVALELAELLPDAAGPGGPERSVETLRAWLDEHHADLSDEDREGLSEGLACYDIGELTGPTHRFAVRAVVVLHEEDPHHVNLVGIRDDETFPMTEAEVFEVEPKYAEEGDVMRLASALIDGLSDYVEEGQSFSLAPAFGALAKPFGGIRVGLGLSPADRRKARADRVKALKRKR
jgi:hypothetical protein